MKNNPNHSILGKPLYSDGLDEEYERDWYKKQDLQFQFDQGFSILFIKSLERVVQALIPLVFLSSELKGLKKPDGFRTMSITQEAAIGVFVGG
ncbi:hypothetical protein E3N88_00979 [Mikania micrantha]|uniref:Uncharacterized protein n=1 Tax=Mikania micrantha TaxID=192012 RepID=A0A5N6Q0D9_9ASTR|nr:hypothetical protein E3N88_00979 [Mikania micrantha]